MLLDIRRNDTEEGTKTLMPEAVDDKRRGEVSLDVQHKWEDSGEFIRV